ncbi:MAG: hypothetical protein IIT51_08395, partial [Oscillospiraceae bacterium]|nr:hypothetical protein [Oscillospiraceae bacterium]
AKRLRAPLDRVTERLPEKAFIKQIGTMTSRGELDIMRLVISFPSWESIFPGLTAIGWQGDTAELASALEPWKESQKIAVNIDLGADGVLPKIGIEVFSRWRHPLIVDKFIMRLEDAGLCLPEKGEALRRWIRIRPDADPFRQTLINYFKLNYKDGKITEAKAYLEQTPYINHNYFDAYEFPGRVDFYLRDGERALSADSALRLLAQCGENRLRRARFMGVEGYEEFDRLLGVCRENSIRAEVSLAEPVSREALEQMIAAGADSFLMDMDGETGWVANAETLRALDFAGFRLRWFMHRGNAQDLPRVIRLAGETGAQELIITGMKPCSPGLRRENPDRGQIIAAAEIINAWQKENLRNGDTANELQDGAAKEAQNVDAANELQDGVPAAAAGTDETAGTDAKSRMELTVESCFSPLRAVMGGADEKRNGNRGIGRGCEAGCWFFAVQADGSFTPCPYLDAQETYGSITEYWEHSPLLKKIRKQNGHEGCPYARRCLPCFAVIKEAGDCPLHPLHGDRP